MLTSGAERPYISDEMSFGGRTKALRRPWKDVRRITNMKNFRSEEMQLLLEYVHGAGGVGGRGRARRLGLERQLRRVDGELERLGHLHGIARRRNGGVGEKRPAPTHIAICVQSNTTCSLACSIASMFTPIQVVSSCRARRTVMVIYGNSADPTDRELQAVG